MFSFSFIASCYVWPGWLSSPLPCSARTQEVASAIDTAQPVSATTSGYAEEKPCQVNPAFAGAGTGVVHSAGRGKGGRCRRPLPVSPAGYNLYAIAARPGESPQPAETAGVSPTGPKTLPHPRDGSPYGSRLRCPNLRARRADCRSVPCSPSPPTPAPAVPGRRDSTRDRPGREPTAVPEATAASGQEPDPDRKADRREPEPVGPGPEPVRILH